MVKYVSPGIYVTESDVSEYTPNISSSRIAIVGTASRGPVNKLTLVGSQNEMISKFGRPSEELYGQGIEGALEILEQANQVYYVRVADSTNADASAAMQFGSCPAITVSASPTDVVGDAFGIGRPLYLAIQAYDNAGNAVFSTPKKFAIPAATIASTAVGASQAKALKSVIGGDMESDKIGIVMDATNASGVIYSRYAGSGAYIEASAYSDATYLVGARQDVLAPYQTIGASAHGGAKWSYQTASFGSTFNSSGASGLSYVVESIDPGGGYNASTNSTGQALGITMEAEARGNGNTVVTLNDFGVQRETFKVNLYNSGTFVEDVINTGETNTTSELVKGNVFVSGTDFSPNKPDSFLSPIAAGLGISTHTIHAVTQLHSNGFNASSGSAVKLINGQLPLGAFNDVNLVSFIEQTERMNSGSDGTGVAANIHTSIVGDSTSEPKTGMQVIDDESAGVDIALIPGIYDHTVRTSLITLAENTQAFLALFSPPYGIGTAGDAIDWTNGKSSTSLGESTTAFNSTYAAVYFPHVKVFDRFTNKDRWYDPTIFAARQMALTDREDEAWFAPAGHKRGALKKPTEVEVKLSQGDRDALYSGGNCVNPIVNFAQQGITIFGQKTTSRAVTSLNRINVRRLMLAVRKAVLQSCRRFVFEPNDVFTYERVEGVLNPFLDEIRRRRGLAEFRVVCDETVNTPARVDRNELFCKVIVKPTKTAEILVFEVNLTNQSANIGNAID